MRYLRLFLRSAALITLFVTASTARPGIRHIDNNPLYGRSHHDTTTFAHQLRSLTNPLSTSAHAPSKRMMPGVTPILRNIKLHMIHFKSIRPIVPVVKASAFLNEFYTDIIISAQTSWALLPRRQYFTVRGGNFELVFYSFGDTIPWEVVSDLAQRLRQCAIIGATDLFEAVFTDDAAQIGLKVTMAIIDESLSSSDDDFREGSVPSVNGPDMDYQQDPGFKR